MKRPREDPGWVRCVLPAIPSQQLPAKVSYLPPHGLQRYKRPPPKVKRDVVEEEPGAVGVEPDDEEDDGAAAAAAAAQSSGRSAAAAARLKEVAEVKAEPTLAQRAAFLLKAKRRS